MFNNLRHKKGQSLVEYSLILGAIIVAILFMQLYVRRALEGRLRDASDSIGDQYSSTGTFNILVNRESNITENRTAAGVTTTIYDYDRTTRTGNETLPSGEDEWWEPKEPEEEE